MYKNKVQLDVTNTMNYLIKKTLNSCSNNPRAFGLPMVKYWLMAKYILGLGNYF